MNWITLTTLILAIIISWVVALYAWSRRPSRGARQLGWLMTMVGWWNLALLVGLSATSFELALLSLKLEYLSVVTVPLLWLWFVLHYTNHEDWLNRPRLLLLSAIPAITLVLALTTPAHDLIVEAESLRKQAQSSDPIFWERGIWGWIDTAYQYIIIAGATGLLIASLFRLPKPFAPQIVTLLIILLISWMANVLATLQIIPLTVPVAPLSFAVSGLGLWWTLFRHRLLEIVPVARTALVEGMSDAIFVCDRQLRLVDLNPAAESLAQTTAQAAIGRPIDHVFPSLKSLLNVAPESVAPVQEREIETSTDDGLRRVYSVHITPLHRRNGQLSGHLCVLRDVTDLQTAREEALRANHAKSEFLSNVSHELRTPLTSIRLYIDLLRRDNPERRARYLASLQREVERLQALIESLLNLSRLDLGKVKPVLQPMHVNPLIAALHRDRGPLFEARELELGIDLTSGLPQVMADRRLLEQVVTNLLSNALNYTPAGGSVRLATDVVEVESEHWVRIKVADTGLGIAAEEQQRLFQRFERGQSSRVTRAPGTGLGLAICKEIVDLHQGRITLDSQLGEGSTFTVWLPHNPRTMPDHEPA